MRLKRFALGLAFAVAAFLDFSPDVVPHAIGQVTQCVVPPAGVTVRRTRYLNCTGQAGAGYAIDALRASDSVPGDVLTVQTDGSILAQTPTGGGGGGTDDQTAAEVPFDASALTGTLAALDDTSDVAAALTAIDAFTLGRRRRRVEHMGWADRNALGDHGQ